MATAQDFEKHLHCPICLETFKSPKVLPCVHTFCRNCLDDHIQKTKSSYSQSFKCPMCRVQIFPVNKAASVQNWAHDFPTNYLVNAMLGDSVAVSVKTSGTPGEQLGRVCLPCSLVDKREHVFCFCINCCEYLCEKCYRDHSKFKMMRSHNVLKGSDIPKDNSFFKKMAEMMVCKQHKDHEVDYMCSSHREFVCLKCIQGTHQSCDVKPITTPPCCKNKFQEYKEIYAALLKRVEEIVNTKVSSLETISKNETAEVKVKESILSELKSLVRYYEDSSMTNMQEKIDCEKAKLSICIAECTGFNDTLNNDSKLAEIVSKYGTDKQAMVMAEQLKANEAKIRNQIVQQESERASLPQFCLQPEEAEKLKAVKALLDNRLEHSNSKPAITLIKKITDVGVNTEQPKVEHKLPLKSCLLLPSNDKNKEGSHVENLSGSSLLICNTCKVGEYDLSIERLSKNQCGNIGCVLLDTGNMVFIDDNNYCLKLVSTDFKVLRFYKLKSRPCDVGLVDQDTVVVGKDKEVWLFKILDSNKIIKIRSFPIRDLLYSVCGTTGNFGILYSRHLEDKDDTYIEIRSPNNTVLHSISKFQNTKREADALIDPFLIRFRSPEEIIFCEKSQLKAIDLNGDLLWYFNYRGTKINSIAFDSDKNIYFGDTMSKSIHQISASSRNYRCLIPDTGIPCPVSIMVDANKHTLVVGFKDSNHIQVYKFQ